MPKFYSMQNLSAEKLYVHVRVYDCRCFKTMQHKLVNREGFMFLTFCNYRYLALSKNSDTSFGQKMRTLLEALD